MTHFLGRNKGRFKRDKNTSVDWTTEYADPDKLKQKYTEKASVTWSDCEYLYSLRVCRHSKRATAPGAKGEADSILALFYLPHERRVTFVTFELVHFVELGQQRFLEDIQHVNNDEGATDVSLSFHDCQLSWKAISHGERDEFVWVLSQLSNTITGLNLPVEGYVPDIDIKEGGYEIKFPALYKLIFENSAAATQGEEEKEAEILLEQLDWTRPVPELQTQLQDDILLLNVEICDLLLQWEHDEGAPGGEQYSSSRVRDTVELLTTLNHVDKELGFVDDWLGNQIGYLSTVQAEIKQIESESGTLETSLQNLTSVKTLISSLTRRLRLQNSDEEVLIRAEKKLKLLMGGATLTSDDVDRVVDPLCLSLGTLRSALSTNEDSLPGPEYSNDDWDHLKLVSGIMEQRQKLNSTSFKFCSSAGEFLSTIFSSILHHKAFNDVSKPDSIIVRKFSFSIAQREVDLCSGKVQTSFSDDERWGALSRKNQILSAQRCYHEALVPFLPLLEHVVALNPALKNRTMKSYVDSTQQYLYSPLIRQVFKEALPANGTLSVISLTSLPRAKASRVFAKTSTLQPPTFSSVRDNLLLILFNICPVVVREELFFENLFSDEGSSLDDFRDSNDTSIQELFSSFRELVLKVVSGTDHVKAMDTLSVLTFVEAMLQYGRHDSSVSKKSVEPVAGYLFPEAFKIPGFVLNVLSEAKDVLLERLDQFISEEVQWIQSGKGGLADAKMLGVFPAVAKFPAFLDVVENFSGLESSPFAEKIVITIGSELLNWLYSCAAMSEKYQHAILIQNLTFFEACVSSRSAYCYYPVLTVLLEEVNQKLYEAERNYLDWMISYELPSFSSLSSKIEGVEKRASRDELSLYVRRQDVIKVISSLSTKTVDSSLGVLRKRLDKHFSTAEASELGLVPKMWDSLENRMHSMFVSMQDIVHASYQLSLSLRPDGLYALFDKYK